MNDLIDDVFGYHRSRSGHPASVMYLLDLAQQRLSSVPADKVYGLLGLIAQSDGRSIIHIKPDYSKSTAEVYREAASSVIESSGDLQVLDYVRHWTCDGELELDDFPSWVPKWHRSKDLEEHPNFMSLTFDASLGRKAMVTQQSDQSRSHGQKILMVSGMSVGTIDQTSPRVKCEEAARAEHLHSILTRTEAMLKKSSSAEQHDLGEDLESSLAITVCAGVDSSYQPARPEIVQSYRKFRNHSRTHRTRLPSISECERLEDGAAMLEVSHFGEAMYNGCMNRKLFTTSQGHFGVGPHFLREGDQVAILYGLKWPAVLRPVAKEQSGAAEYFFLGTSYCFGIMHGEAVGENGSSSDNFFIR
nr:heterokaryon incompatibility protein 6, or allele [Quercus suber]